MSRCIRSRSSGQRSSPSFFHTEHNFLVADFLVADFLIADFLEADSLIDGEAKMISISIWFFIGISLAVNGALILAAGIYQLVNPPANPGVVSSTCMPMLGARPASGGRVIYCFKSRPRTV